MFTLPIVVAALLLVAALGLAVLTTGRRAVQTCTISTRELPNITATTAADPADPNQAVATPGARA